MTKQAIGLGSSPNDGTGDTIRAGGDKINDNFDEIYTLLGDGTTLTSGLSATTSVVTLAAPTITSVASFAAGSASAPSITKTGDTNTGIYFSAADEVAITTGGTQRVKVTDTATTLAGNLVIPDAGNIGSASDTDAVAISSGGVVSFSASTITGGNGSSGGVTIADGGIQVRTGTGSVAYVDLYCESSNAHRVRVQSPAHADYSGNVTLTLPNETDTLAGQGEVVALSVALG